MKCSNSSRAARVASSKLTTAARVLAHCPREEVILIAATAEVVERRALARLHVPVPSG